MSSQDDEKKTTHPDDWFANLILFLSSRFLGNISFQVLSVAVGWQVYSLTKRPLDLGIVGLVQFLPVMCFSLLAGQTADQYSRKKISIIAYAVSLICSVALALTNQFGGNQVYWIFAILLIHATCRAFAGPSLQSLLPDLVPREQFPRVVAWNSALWQTAMTLGPLLGGLLYGWTEQAEPVYLCSAVCLVIALGLQFYLRVFHKTHKTPATLETFFAGLKYVWNNKNLLGAISLDLFAVLLGGSVAMLPAFANDVLQVGPMGLGILRSAPGIGAVLTGIYIATHPLQKRAGAKMFIAVAVFGLAQIAFGLSHNFVLSFALLFITGVADIFSVVVRGTLVQLETPQNMRGRVSAVNMIFIGASNELGEFESGITAQWFGLVPSVIIGGMGTVLVAIIWSRLFPSLRNLDKLA